MRPRNPAPGSAQYVSAICTAAESIGDVVYVSGPMVGGVVVVSKADATNETKMPGFGLIVKKPSPTQCIVQRAGRVDGVYSGLTVNQRYWVDSSGVLSSSYPRPGYAQAVALAVDPTSLQLDFGFRMIQVLA
jgi:hypothetical protein